MLKTLLAALAAATILSGATLGTRAVAMPLAAPSTLGAADASSTMPTRVAIICGMNGCAPVHVARVRRPPPSFVTGAAPLVFPSPNSPQNSAAKK
jgi:hypothetical protein